MRVINVSLSELETKVLMIGFQDENEITQVRIDAAEILTDYPNATPTLIAKPLFGFAYPVIVTKEGTDIVWEIDNSVLSFHGDGEIQLTFTQGTVIAKSYVGRIRIKRSLAVNGEKPDPIETWEQAATAKLAEVDAQIDELEDMVEAAEAAKDQAQDIVDDATADIQAAGAAQVGNVNTAGSTQVSAVQAKGTEVLNSIPADYTTLSGDVTGLKSAIDELPTQEQLAAVYGKVAAWGNIIDYLAHNIAYTSDDAGAEVLDMIDEAESEEVLSIHATYTGGNVVVGSSLDSIKSNVICIVIYESGIRGITNQFTLSGTIASGSNTITVSYEGKTDTITVVGVTLSSISAVYSGGSVYVGTDIETLRTDLVVTATYSDNSTAIVTDYSLSGSIASGTNTITVTYQSLATSFTVTGIADVPYGLVTPDSFAQSGATTTNTFGSTGFPLTYSKYKLVVSFIMASLTEHSIIVVVKINDKLWGYNSSGWFKSSGVSKPSETFSLDTQNLSTMTINNIPASIFDQGGTVKIGDTNTGFNGVMTFASYKLYGVDAQGNETLLSDVRPTSTVGVLKDRVVNTNTTAFSNTTGFSVVVLED